ncbi:cyclin-A3-1-like isoform X1 [Lolium perenne]|uniref:cyclin-A3-1-like isoform X1 n=1 Tax=Lolium perenne TaxID=4522 RepID=UPI003A9A296F
MEPRGRRRKQQATDPELEEAMGNKENSASAAPPPKKPRTDRKPLAELPTTATNASASAASAPIQASKRTTRAAAREAAAAAVEEEARKREAAAIAPRPAASKQPDAGAAQASVAPYVGDIDQYLRSLEAEQLRRPRDDYIGTIQNDISANMRGILVDWLVDVADEFKLLADTLYLAVSYIDRFLTVSVVSRNKLQLLGVASLLVAAKYEEIYLPKVNEFSEITDGTYTKQQVVKMEADILKFLNFQVGGPTIRTFLRKFLTSCRGGNPASAKRLELTCSYLAELSLIDYDCIKFLPSVIAAACLFVARLTISPKTRPWNLTLQESTGYKVSDLKSCILRIHDLQLGRKYPTLKASKSKYSDRKFGCVSTVTAPEEIPASFLEDTSK